MKNLLFLLAIPMAFSTLFAHGHNDTALGINSHQISEKSASTRGYEVPYGSLIRYIYPKSGAESAGLQVFDYVYQINETQANKEQSIGDLIKQYQPGDQVQVYFYRNGVANSTQVTLSNGDDLDRIHRNREEDPFLGVGAIHRENPPGIQGVAVDIVDNSTAQALGLQDEDIIVQIDDYRIYNWSDIHSAIEDRAVGELIRVKYYRDGFNYSVERAIKSQAATHNDHSRANGPVIVGTPEPDLEVAPAILQSPQTNDTDLPKINETPLPIANEIRFEELKVFPNPNDGIFNLELELPQRGRTSIQVFDANGKRVYENNLGNFKGIFSDRIDIANTAKGIYFLLLRQDDKTLSKRLVIQ